MALKLRIFAFFSALMALTLVTVGVAQGVVLFDPATWFASSEAVLIAAGLITPWVTKIFTALGKDWFNTEGQATQWLSLGVAIIIGGVGGFLSLGYFADVSGIQGAIQAAFLIAVAFLGSNGMAKADRQVAVSAAGKMQTQFMAQSAATAVVAAKAAEKASNKTSEVEAIESVAEAVEALKE